ncbi:MAG: tRNA (adenine-N1)-methyltransferase [Actinomyces sp.]|uniref:tRNA (adenine-N1)-methyltransferase n=1 Tax=Actinomyces sp. TaxID=29317 RepID=UPI0026DBB0B5|nr:tRNA (adenine-N1)-methyltransferase [Actinomyces sp.]MDO4243863.1 tRNA (adenine-N1)-methyltransferase [Actinomyces sp.]
MTEQHTSPPQAQDATAVADSRQTAAVLPPRTATQEVLGQAGRRGPFRYGERVQVTDVKGAKNTFQLDPGGYFQSVRGSFRHRDVVGLEEGTVLTTESGHELLLLRPLLADYVLSMPRGAQVVYAKDSGQIIAMGDIFPGARVVEAGVGSGALTMNLLSAVGESGRLLSIERRADFAQIAASNVDSWFGRHHPAWELRTGDFAEVTAHHVAQGSIDRIVLDMLAPWENIAESARVLVPGGLLLAYVATTTQLSRTVEALRHSRLFTEPESWESMVRTWNVDGLSVRPDHRMVAHTGFLLTARRLAAGSLPLTRKRPPARGAYDDAGYWLPEDVRERTSTDRKVRRVLRDCLAKQPQDRTPVLPGTPLGQDGGSDKARRRPGTEATDLTDMTDVTDGNDSYDGTA